MAMKAWDKLNLEQKLRRVETAWRMQAEGRPPIEYASYLSPAMLKSQFNNSIEEPPPGALPQSLFDASESVRRGYTPPTGPDPPGPWSELPPQMQEGYGGGAPIPGGYDDQGARVGLDMPGQTYGQPINAAQMVGPAQPTPMPAGNWGVNGGAPAPRPMVNSPRSGIQMPGVNGVGNVMDTPRTSPMGPAQFPTPDPINMMPQGQRISDSAVGLGNRLPQDLTNQIINQFAGSTAPVPGQTAPDINVPQGVPNIPSMMAVPQPQPSLSGGMGDLGLGRIPQGIAPPMDISTSPSGHNPLLTPGIEYGRMTTDSGRLVRDLSPRNEPQGIAPPMSIAATPNDGQGLWDRISGSVGGLSGRIGGAINNRVGTFLDSRNNGMPQMSPGNNGRHKGSETEIKSLTERLELNKSHSRLGGISASRKLQLSRDRQNLQNRLAMIQSTFPGAQIPQLEESYTLEELFGGLHGGRFPDLQSPIDQIAEAREAYNMPKLDHQTKMREWRRRIDPLIEREHTPIPELTRHRRWY